MQNQKNRLTGYILLATCLMSSPVNSNSSFEQWKQQQQAGYKQSKNEFEQYRDEVKSAFNEYRRKIQAIWGDDEVTPNAKNWVSYINDLSQRSVVDFETGIVTVEVAVSDDQPLDKDQLRQQLASVMLQALVQGDDRRSIQKLAEQPIARPEGKPVLSGQVSDTEGYIADESAYPAIIEKSVEKPGKKIILGDDGVKRIVYQAQLKLVPQHIRLRAEKFQPLVDKYSRQYRLPAPIVYAVIETESMFNPTARSSAPAFGLMQLVPTSGARDAYRFLYNRDRVVTDQYLYDPENNIRLGSAYLYQLNNVYLNEITSEHSRMLASIAAYNTGTGNVFRAFAGKYNRAKFGSYTGYQRIAIREINRRSPDEVYRYLRQHLPYQETRQYIKKVTERVNKYEQGI